MTRIETIDLDGDPYERGVALGIARRDRIGSCLTDWIGSLTAGGVDEPRAHLARMLDETDFDTTVRRHAPDLLDEVRGIADGAGQPFDLVYSAQLMDEEWAYRSDVSRSVPPLEKCSSIAMRTRDDVVLLGQNMDLGGYTDGHQVLHHIAPWGGHPGALVFSISSMIGLLGVNSHRIGVCVNSVPQLPAARTGMPVAFMIRKLLQARTLDEAVETLHGIPHATGQHYLIADDSEVRSFEASPTGIREYHSPDPRCVIHTNHPLTGSPAGPYDAPSSLTRLATLEARLTGVQLDLDQAKAALSSRDDPQFPVSIARDPTKARSVLTGMIGFTTGSMISVLRRAADEVEAWVSPGPPAERGYERHVLDATA